MDSITLRNFRCFREKKTARLAPLTLLVGENSAGKTSFMAMIRALWDMVYRGGSPDFKEDPYDLGSFDEIAHYRGGRAGRATTLEAGFEFTRTARARKGSGIVGGPLRFEVTLGKKGTIPVPVRRRFSQKDAWVELSQTEIRFRTKRGTWKRRRTTDFISVPGMELPFVFFLRHFLAIERSEKNQWTEVSGSDQPTQADFKQIDKILSLSVWEPYSPYGDRLYASAPVRSKPRRTYDPARPTRDPEGDYIPMYLSNLYFQNKEQWETLKDALEKFGQDAGLFDEISVKPLGKKETEPFQVQIRKFGKRVKGPQRNLIDVGYGVSQVLPVITELLRDDALPMFLLQQPEVHLHPSAQAALGSLFCQVATPDRQLIVETHSDHLLDRVRMDIRDGTTRLKPDDVSILFFERKDLDVRIHSIRLDEEGNVLGVPEGYRRFFLEETARSLWKRQSIGT